MQALQFPKEIQRTKFDLPLNERLKEARMNKKMSAAGVVRELKKRGVQIGHSTLAGYEAAEGSKNHRYPPYSSLLALADYYEVSLDYLFGRSDDMLRDKDYFSKGINKNLKRVINSGETILWGRKKITPKQCKLLEAHIELMLNRSF